MTIRARHRRVTPARESFKAWWTEIVPPEVERSTLVLAASVCLFLLCWYWRPIPRLARRSGANRPRSGA